MKPRALTAREVESLMRWLRKQQRADGRKADDATGWNHGTYVGAMAMAHDTIEHISRTLRRKGRK